MADGIFARLFGSREKPPSARDLKVAFAGVQRERKKKQLELRKLNVKKQQTIENLKRARKNNNKIEVDFLWEELKTQKVEGGYILRDAQILNLEGIGLKRYIRGLERLEKTGQSGKVKNLIEKVQRLGLDEKLRGSEVDEAAYLDSLRESLDEVELELDGFDAESDLDPEKEKFLAQIDLINSAEDKGDFEDAKLREEKLQEQIKDDDVEVDDNI